MKNIVEIIQIPAGTELDRGVHEDSDPLTLTEPIKLIVIGNKQNGAIPVRMIIDGVPDNETLYYHQPQSRN